MFQNHISRSNNQFCPFCATKRLKVKAEKEVYLTNNKTINICEDHLWQSNIKQFRETTVILGKHRVIKMVKKPNIIEAARLAFEESKKQEYYNTVEEAKILLKQCFPDNLNNFGKFERSRLFPADNNITEVKIKGTEIVLQYDNNNSGYFQIPGVGRIKINNLVSLGEAVEIFNNKI